MSANLNLQDRLTQNVLRHPDEHGPRLTPESAVSPTLRAWTNLGAACAIMSSAEAVCPGFKLTATATSSPIRSSGIGTDAASATRPSR